MNEQLKNLYVRKTFSAAEFGYEKKQFLEDECSGERMSVEEWIKKISENYCLVDFDNEEFREDIAFYLNLKNKVYIY